MKQVLKLISILLICFFQNLISFAQTPNFEFSNEIKDIHYATHIPSQDSNLTFLFKSKKELEISWLTKGERQSVVVSNIEKLNKLITLGGTSNDKTISTYFYNEKHKTVSNCIVNKENGNISQSILFSFQGKQQILTAFEHEGYFYILSVLEENNSLTIHKYQDNNLVFEKTQIIPFKEFYKSLLLAAQDQNKENLISDVYITTYTKDELIPLSQAETFQKLYISKSKIIFTIEDKSAIHLLTLDYNAEKVVYKKLNFKLDNEKDTDKYLGNSYIYKQNLYRLTVNKNQLNLCVVAIDSFKLVNNYNVYRDKEFDLANTPIFEEINGKLEPDLLSTKDFFDEITRGQPAIVVNTLSKTNTLEVQIGSLRYETVQMMPMGMGMGGGMAGGSLFLPNVPLTMYPGMGIWPPMYYPNNNVSVRQIVTFTKSVLTADAKEHLKDVPTKNIFENIKDFETLYFKNKHFPDVTLTYMYKGKLHYGFCVKKTKAFKVFEFEN